MDTLMLLRIYIRVFNLINYCSSNISYTWRTLVDAYSVKTHLFFDRIAAPYMNSAVNIGAPSSALPLWTYQDDTKTFVEWTLMRPETMPKAHQLPILSMSVVSDERVVHDITDFVDSLQVCHSNPDTFPSIAHSLGAWSLSSRIVLNPTAEYYVTIITSSADTIAITCDSHAYFTLTVGSTDSVKETSAQST